MNSFSVEEFVGRLKGSRHQIAFAESCTAGKIAATLGQFPGISEVLVGSAVVYQIPTKCEWLGVDFSTIEQHGVVSEQVSVQMAEGVLERTPHADVAASITGHLGPNAPRELDGIAWSAVSIRRNSTVVTKSQQLKLLPGPNDPTGKLRRLRMEAGVLQVLEFCDEVLFGDEG